MLDELNPIEGIDGVDNLNELDSLSEDVVSHVDDIDPLTVDPTVIDDPTPCLYGPDSGLDPDPDSDPQSLLHPDLPGGYSFKGGACVCSCDMSCTVGY